MTASSYFFLISFEWPKVFDALGIPEAERKHLKFNMELAYKSPNANDGDDLGIDEESAHFEYYISPNALRNGWYKYGSVYDQQLKRFFETPNINYGTAFSGKTEKEDELWIGCLFSSNLVKSKAGFSINYGRTGEEDSWSRPDSTQRTLVILFDEKYLNLQDAHKTWSDKVSYRTLLISSDNRGDSEVKEITLPDNSVWVNTDVQSLNDAQVSPFGTELSKYFKQNPN